jgi:O-antigen biosynthesis protein
VNILVCIPVYNGFDSVERCLAALSRARVTTAFRTLIINDASPDERIAPMLNAYALAQGAQARTQVRHNALNRGFTWNVNQAFAAARADEHICLLNSDALVTTGWLDQMLACVTQDATHPKAVGTVTPFSNNATICSFPDFSRTWPVPDVAERERIAQAMREKPSAPVDLPTGVGFCMLISAACRAKVGVFDIENFPRGYGEENDFCMRAAAAGFRNVLCTNAYVAHEGGVSFSDSTQALMKAGAARLLAKHPTYDAQVADWIAHDPAKSRRDEVASLLQMRLQ